MPNSKHSESDIFVRHPVLKAQDRRERFDRNSVLAEADVAGCEPFMEASIAAGMIVAHADGLADVAEYRRIIGLFRTHPVLKVFSVDDIGREINEHEAAFAIDSADALRRAREQIRHADLTDRQFNTLIGLCYAVIEADGIAHPAEEQALEYIRTLRPT